MRTIRLFLATMVLITMTGCGDSDDDANTQLSGNLYFDENGNGTRDNDEDGDLEDGIPDVDILIEDSSDEPRVIQTDQNGDWNIQVDNGEVTINIQTNDTILPNNASQTEGMNPTTIDVTNQGPINIVQGFTYVSQNLLGKWTLEFLIVDGDFESDFACEERIDYTFNSDNTYSQAEFFTNNQGNCNDDIEFTGTWEALTEESIELTPNNSSISGEIIDFKITNNDEIRLEIERDSTRTEIYQRP